MSGGRVPADPVRGALLPGDPARGGWLPGRCVRREWFPCGAGRGVLRLLALLLLAGGCKIQETGRADSMVADSLAAGDRQAMQEVRRAVDVARALRARPDSADAILTAHRITRSGLDSLLYRIAADPRLATQYERGLASASADEL